MKKQFLKGLAVCCVAAACAMTLAACSGTDAGKTGTVAATVNGDNIYEEDVTAYIESYRSAYSMTDEESWAKWMSSYGYEPSTVREAIIDSFVSDKLVEQACKELNVEVDEDTVESYVQSIKQYYSSDEEWQSALTEAGLTEDEYRENIRASLRSDALQDSVAADATASDEDILEGLKTYIPYYDGVKRSSHILFDASDTETAQKVLDEINAGGDFAALASQYSKDSSASNGGDVGYDTGSFVEEYTNALDALEVGQVSGLVTSDYGIHIIKCTDEFKAPETIESADGLPEAFVSEITEYINSNAKTDAYSKWMEEYEGKATIEIKDMPSGLSYDVDMSKYESTDTEDGESVEAVDGEDSEDGEEADAEEDGEVIELQEDESGYYYLDEDGEKVYLDLSADEEDAEADEEDAEAESQE